MTMSYRIAHSTGIDAVNQQMRAAGHTNWNEEDAAPAAATLHRLYPLCVEHPGIEPELCGCAKCRNAVVQLYSHTDHAQID